MKTLLIMMFIISLSQIGCGDTLFTSNNAPELNKPQVGHTENEGITIYCNESNYSGVAIAWNYEVYGVILVEGWPDLQAFGNTLLPSIDPNAENRLYYNNGNEERAYAIVCDSNGNLILVRIY